MSKLISLETCTDKCKLTDHGEIITSAITKKNITDRQLACYISSKCKNYAQVSDDAGRNALHMAASCGRAELCYWLVKVRNTDANVKDKESGCSPLHRSIFYGNIDIAVNFIKVGSQVHLMDKDDLRAVDYAMKDRLVRDFSIHNPCQVYIWGSNNNYTLGTGNQHSRTHPEPLDFFRKNNTSIKQVAMDKFHSVFVSGSGRAWSCGIGHGGRLGLDSEQTVLTPQPLRTGAELVESASVGRNHTILLTDSGGVWTCGSNVHHVLGHSQPPPALMVARCLPPRLLKPAGGPVVGIAAARFHSVLWSNSTVLTFGLNGGQLGHPKMADKTIITPKPVNLGPKNRIVDVATSVGAVVVLVARGDIYLLHKYRIIRIASKILGAVKVTVFGGELNPEVDQKLSAKGGEELRMMVLTATGKVMLWQESYPQLTRCIYSLKRGLTFCNVTLNHSNALLITNDGEAYIAHVKLKPDKKPVVSTKVESPINPKMESVQRSFNQFLESIECHHMNLSRVPHIHRAVCGSSDPRGHNFAIIQENPNVNLTDIPLVDESEFSQQMAALLDNATEDDSLHDVIIEVSGKRVAAHHFVLAHLCEEFAERASCSRVHTTIIQLKDVNEHVFDQVIRFIYTHDCDIIHLGPFKSLFYKGDIIKAALDLSRKWKINSLIKILQQLRYENGVIVLKEDERQHQSQRPRLERSMFSVLHDVYITSGEGTVVKAHKCILAARLEYFNHMFLGGWAEADRITNLTLPIPHNVLLELVNFLYRDEASTLAESMDVEYISSVIVVADQLFVNSLKQVCEVALAANLSLRNAAYLMQLAVTYHADQLLNTSMQFVCLNLAAVLESRILEILDSKTLTQLSQYYRKMIPAMCTRKITPYSTDPQETEILEIANNNPVPWIESEEILEVESTKNRLNKSNPIPITTKKKRSRKSSESQRKRYESVSSNSDLDCSVELTSSETIDFDDLVERNQTEKIEKWVKVDKAQKTVQNRLKAIMAVSVSQPVPEDFTPLVASASLCSSPPHASPPPATSPLLQESRHFPNLASPPQTWSIIDLKPAVKMSQKQRKKLQADGGLKEVTEPVAVTRSVWAPVNSPLESSLADIMAKQLTGESSPAKSEQGMVKFADIMAEEIQQRDNWSKMKSKSLQLTQIEDKAMEELSVFYNAANVFDERITVQRVLSANIAKPTWVTSRHQ